MELVARFLDETFEPEGVLMGEVAQYVRGLRGKMLRPAFVCLTARSLGYDPHGSHGARLGASLELFHVATLLHDDVIDNASLRRGRDTVNKKWGNDVAILFADYLYAASFDHALAVLRPEIVQVLSRTTKKMTEGEMFQIERRGQWLTPTDYFSIIRSKTAYLFSACTGLGALVAEADPDIVARFFDFGLHFGMAFQLTDDALDYEAQGDAWGKRVGADLQEGKQTLPLLYTLEQANEADRASLLHTLENGRDFDLVHRLVKRYNGIDYALERAAEFTRIAAEQLDGMEDNEALSLLRRLNEGVVMRQV
jgi:octaprenyl-diphosphate synthase